MNKIEIAKHYLKENQIDAWVIYDYECHNDALISFTGKKMLTRKVFMVIPQKEKPYIIAHKIDNAYLDVPDIRKDFDLINYQTWTAALGSNSPLLSADNRLSISLCDSTSLITPHLQTCRQTS